MKKHQPNQKNEKYQKKPDSCHFKHLNLLLKSMMNENIIFKEYEYIKPLIEKIDSRIDFCNRDCHSKYFHTFGHICVYDIKLTNFAKKEIVNITISDKSMIFYDLKKIKNCWTKRFYIYSKKQTNNL